MNNDNIKAMRKHIGARRLFEITVRIVSLLFAIEVLFTVLFFLSMNKEASESFRSFILNLQNVTGISVSILCALLMVFAVFLFLLDFSFPVGGFLVSLIELVLSVIFTIFTETSTLLLFKGLTLRI